MIKDIDDLWICKDGCAEMPRRCEFDEDETGHIVGYCPYDKAYCKMRASDFEDEANHIQHRNGAGDIGKPEDADAASD